MLNQSAEIYGAHSLWAKGYAKGDNLHRFYDTLDDPNATVGLEIVSLRKPRHSAERKEWRWDLPMVVVKAYEGCWHIERFSPNWDEYESGYIDQQ